MCSSPEIEKMKRESHPMEAKKDLARRIVTDFHSADAAAKAAEDWAKQFQKDVTPENLEEIEISVSKVKMSSVLPDPNENGEAQLVTSDREDAEVFRTDKLIREAGLAASGSEAQRKIKEKAVHINGHLIGGSAILACPREPLVVRVGKKIKKIRLV